MMQSHNPFGVPFQISPHAVHHTHDEFDPIPFSRHRSRRIWKKLLQRQARTRRKVERPGAFSFQGRMIIHPAVYRELQRI